MKSRNRAIYVAGEGALSAGVKGCGAEHSATAPDE